MTKERKEERKKERNKERNKETKKERKGRKKEVQVGRKRGKRRGWEECGWWVGYNEFDFFLENKEYRPFDGCKIEI